MIYCGYAYESDSAAKQVNINTQRLDSRVDVDDGCGHTLELEGSREMPAAAAAARSGSN